MSDARAKVQAALAGVRRRCDFAPTIGVVLGSGLGPLAELVRPVADISTADIPNFPRSTVAGHEGRLILGTLERCPVVILKGRVHGYEGYDVEDVVLPVRLMAALGARGLVLTNAAGGVNRSFRAGDVMVIEDHINLQGQSPLRGPNVAEWGARFPDMSAVYSPRLRELAQRCAAELGLTLRRGVYASLPGPQYETPAEIRMLATLGADAVGMSTVPEAIAARHMGLEIVGFSVISNLAAGISPVPLSHEEVVAMGAKVGADLSRLVAAMIARWSAA
jgi:purine-nucleoside phosphorylase